MALSASVQQSQTVGRQSQPVQMNNLQTPANVAISSQATIHVLPTAQTTVNVTQRPGNPTATRAPAPRAPNAPHMVYTTTTMPTTPVQTPIRNAVVQSQNLRQISPQAGGVPVRMQQTTSYVVNNGISMGSGPQLTVHHRPPQVAECDHLLYGTSDLFLIPLGRCPFWLRGGKLQNQSIQHHFQRLLNHSAFLLKQHRLLHLRNLT
ncbi:activating transcription factor 7-interacting protein 1-like [Hyperolius riggenbachi]|uniref:activating transcription factor 7-interacting protein 1-like n=1 Tax=Hyperolius riggenbachi TaxID=752182 RepID=UPI0035A262C9